MNKTLRWILIAVVGVALVCLAVGAAFGVLRGVPQLLNLGSRVAVPRQGIPRVMPPFDQNPPNPRGIMPFGPRRGIGGFGGFGGILGIGFTLLRLLVPVFIVFLLILAVVLLLRRPAAQAAVSASPPGPTIQPVAAETPCPNCGRPVQAEWVACPYCGHRLRETL